MIGRFAADKQYKKRYTSAKFDVNVAGFSDRFFSANRKSMHHAVVMKMQMGKSVLKRPICRGEIRDLHASLILRQEFW